MERSTVTIRETSDGWEVSRGNLFANTAAEALNCVKQQDQELASRGISNITVITWEPTTRLGRRVIKALQ